jgi:hypothetical protein
LPLTLTLTARADAGWGTPSAVVAAAKAEKVRADKVTGRVRVRGREGQG